MMDYTKLLAHPITPGKVAQIFGVSVDTVQSWDKTGKLKASRTPGNRRIYSRQQVENLMKQAGIDESYADLMSEQLTALLDSFTLHLVSRYEAQLRNYFNIQGFSHSVKVMSSTLYYLKCYDLAMKLESTSILSESLKNSQTSEFIRIESLNYRLSNSLLGVNTKIDFEQALTKYINQVEQMTYQPKTEIEKYLIGHLDQKLQMVQKQILAFSDDDFKGFIHFYQGHVN